MLIDKTLVNKKSNPYIISEIGLNHNGDFYEAINLINDSKAARCDAVKFQIRSESFFEGDIKKMEIGQQYVYEYIKNTYLNYIEYAKLFRYARELDLDVIVSCWDIESLLFAKEEGIRTLKIASADLTNHLLIERSLELFENIIMSTGMSTQSEIESSIKYILTKCKNLCLLHCSSTYPAPVNTLNLNFIERLKKSYPELLIGYSGHEIEYHVCLIAQAKGATIFEKHITRNKSFKGNDHKVSLLKDEMHNLVNMLNDGFKSLGNDEDRVIQPGEKMNRVSLSKSLSLNEDRSKGEQIKLKDLDFTYGGRGIAPDKYKLLIDKTLIRNKSAGEILEMNDFKEYCKKVDLNLKPIRNCVLGIPVRYHDAKDLYESIPTDFLEFHLSYKDIDLNISEIRQYLKDLNLNSDHTFHAPDFYSNDLIFDPLSSNLEIKESSRMEFKRFLEHVTEVKKNLFKTKSNIKTKIVTSFSCSTLYKMFSKRKKDILYERLSEYLDELKISYPDFHIIPQTLPVHAWYLGGRRYVNIFADPREVFYFCEKSGTNICLDTAHTIMASNFYGLNSKIWLKKLLRFSNHIHLVDAGGEMDEGLNFGEGELNLVEFTKNMMLKNNLSYIPEVWQGHHNNGQGFKEAISRINKLLKK